ncbi:transglutaminase-like domain-containing protein [Tepidamorphus sp. 3E244]|uniref:transglutaminase-like domain-containing protein n=1 Tax=Tepidamorphus sp. 3E244 TaxID=3385498 RepID=UPI0038FC3BC5
MHIRIGYEIEISCEAAIPMLLAMSTHTEFAGRIIGSDNVRTSRDQTVEQYIDLYGNKISRIVAQPGVTTVWSDCVAEVDGEPDHVPWNAVQHAVEDLPPETLRYLVASRYCDSDELINFAWQQFGHLTNGCARVMAICDFVHNNTTFGYKFARTTKTATDVLGEKTGVCRDFAHLSVALCRAMNIPARYASGYLGDIGVPDTGFDDFCAWFEVYIGGQWHTFDARYNTPRIGRVLMVRGADAADVAMMTSFGNYRMNSFRVWSEELPDGQSDADLLAMLEHRHVGRPQPIPVPTFVMGATAR